MPRRFLIVALAVLAAQIAQVLLLGVSPSGTLVANLLEIFASLFAAAMCFAASRRAQGMARPFWSFLACGMAVWAVANLGWMYYELALHQQPPAGSAIRFLFNSQAIFFAIVLFLDQEKDSSRFEPEFLLDFTQIAIVFFFVYLGLYYLPSAELAPASGATRRLWVEFGEVGTILVLACFQVIRARVRHIRKLYSGFATYLLIFTVGMILAEFHEASGAPAGTLFDLCWTIPFLWAAGWAARWQPVQPDNNRSRKQTFADVVIRNGMFVVAPLVVLIQIAQFPSGWRALRFSLLAISILCFAVRLGMSAFREAETSETVRRQTLAMDFAADGISILSEAGTQIYANAAFAKMMGYDSPESMLGVHWRKIYHTRDVESLERTISEALAANGRWSGQIMLRRRDSTVIPVEMSIAALPNGVTACIGHDISARKAAEQAREAAESKYRKLIEQVAAISYIAELGVKGKWYYVSPQVEAITGFTPDEWLANSEEWMRHIPVEDHPVVEEAEAASLRGQRFQAEYRIIRKDGATVWVNDTAVVVPGSDSHPVMEGIIVDITDRKRLETQLQQSRRMEAVGRLAGGIAHDFNNLLTVIKGYTELVLQRPELQNDIRSDVMQVENASERATVLVRQLLAFGRRQVLQPKLIDLNAIVLGLDKLLGRLLGEHIEKITRCAADIGAVRADPAQIEQVFMNLVVNARDAMPDGGRLTVETMNVELDSSFVREHVTVNAGSYVMLAVSDTGIGMTQETTVHIFEPFYTTKEGGRGTGLGLSTVYGIVKQSGGYIWVYSEPGHGTTFKVYLPRIDEKPDEKPELATIPVSRKGTETVLLVEDEEPVRSLVSMILSGKGYHVLAAQSWHEAEHFSVNHPGEIHLLLTDIIMPGLSGPDLARRVTARHPHTRVLFMSGYTDNVLGKGGVIEEGVAFLQKPFTPATLTQKVREVLDAPVAAR
jgi:PAS domain S-box-containing protein